MRKNRSKERRGPGGGDDPSRHRATGLASLRTHAKSIGSLPALQPPDARQLPGARRRISLPVDVSHAQRPAWIPNHMWHSLGILKAAGEDVASAPRRSPPGSRALSASTRASATSAPIGAVARGGSRASRPISPEAVAEEGLGLGPSTTTAPESPDALLTRGVQQHSPSTSAFAFRAAAAERAASATRAFEEASRPLATREAVEVARSSRASSASRRRSSDRGRSSLTRLCGMAGASLVPAPGADVAKAQGGSGSEEASHDQNAQPPAAREVFEPASRSCADLRPSKLNGLAGASLIPTCGADVGEVCQMARRMPVPAVELQQPYSLFMEFAHLPLGGASKLRDGRLTQEQFERLVRQHVVGSSQTKEDRIMKWQAIQRAFKVADADGDGLVCFQEFATWMLTQAWDEDLHIDGSERELRRIAREHRASLVEVDRYKRMFDELDTNGSGAIESCEFDQLLHRCGNIPARIGLSAQRRHTLWQAVDPHHDGCMDFEGFVKFNLKYFAEGATGFSEIYDFWKSRKFRKPPKL